MDIQIPLSSANSELQDLLERKKRLIVFNKMDLANPNMILVSIGITLCLTLLILLQFINKELSLHVIIPQGTRCLHAVDIFWFSPLMVMLSSTLKRKKMCVHIVILRGYNGGV